MNIDLSRVQATILQQKKRDCFNIKSKLRP